MITRDEMLQAAIELCKDELRDRLMRFRETPLGKAVQRTGRKIIEAHNTGSKMSSDEIVDICTDICGSVETDE